MSATANTTGTPMERLPRLAVDNGWATSTTRPDYFRHVVTTAFNDFAGTVRMVFDADTGKLLGGYLAERRGTNWHTERITQVAGWLTAGAAA